jgi:shikimate dehydrogenase
LETQTASADLYAVVGNPVAHSLSPQIHRAFAQQSHQLVDYSAIEFALDDFELQLRELQEQGLKGVNVTVPFKRQAWEICDQRSPRADDAGAVNTLVFTEDGNIAGDNTDGVGLTRDLLNNHRALIRHKKILILGAGGAVRGVLSPLLALEPDNLTIANRTLEKAEILAEDFRNSGDFQVCGFDDLGQDKFDLIINATAAGLDNEVPPIPEDVLGINSICYDMMYNIHSPTAFVNWAQRCGASRAIDGLGMLVEQAAESFFIWRGVRVDTAEVIAALRQ